MSEAMRPMTLARFAVLVDAYGGAVARWPVGERAAALVIAETHAGRELLAEADATDALLDTYCVDAPSHALHRAVIATGPQPRSWPVLRWWQGLGLAGAGLSGAVAGAVAFASVPVAPVLPAAGSAEWHYGDEATVFGDLAPERDG